jgi:hypothetical protein
MVCGASSCANPAGLGVDIVRAVAPVVTLLPRPSTTDVVSFSRRANTIETALATVTVLFEFIVFFDVLV